MYVMQSNILSLSMIPRTQNLARNFNLGAAAWKLHMAMGKFSIFWAQNLHFCPWNFYFLSADENFHFLRILSSLFRIPFSESRISILSAKFAFSERRISIFEHGICIFWTHNSHFQSAEFWRVCILMTAKSFIILLYRLKLHWNHFLT